MSAATISASELTGRVALFGRVWAGSSALGVLIRAFTIVTVGEPEDFLRLAYLVQILSAVIPLGMWLISRAPRTLAFCRTVEAVGLVTSAATMAFMCVLLRPDMMDGGVRNIDFAHASQPILAFLAETIAQYFALVAVFSVTVMFTLRSAIIPSLARRTIVLGLLMGATMLLVLTLGYEPPPGGETNPRLTLAIGSGAFWALGVAVCAFLSAIIHGLRREVADAKLLGQYTLEDKIGEGGMGTVYRARHAMLRRPTAVKLLRPERMGEQALKRFEREVQLTAELTHPNTVTIFDYGRTPEGVFYYAMELLEGATLEAIVETTGRQAPERVVHILRMIAGALVEAHGKGLVHRDIKPANVVLSEKGGVLDVATVLDFGLVRELSRTEEQGETMDDAIVGTPMYLAPEAIQSDAADERSDIYAVGAVGYFLLTGLPVFEGKTIVEICSHHIHTPPVRPSERVGAPIHTELEKLVLRCLEKRPADRPVSASELQRALAALDIAEWTPANARAWWDTHAEVLNQRPASSMGPKTFVVDPNRR